MDNNEIRELLDDEIRKTLTVVATTSDMNSDKFKAAMGKLRQLHDERTKELEAALKEQQRKDSEFAKMQEIDQKSAELDMKVRQMADEIRLREAELAAKNAELEEQKKGRRVRTVLDILGITVPVGVSSYWMWKGMKFEEDGKIYTSRTGRWLSEHLRLFGKKG